MATVSHRELREIIVETLAALDAVIEAKNHKRLSIANQRLFDAFGRIKNLKERLELVIEQEGEKDDRRTAGS